MVKKSKIGYYLIFRYNSSPDIVSKLERFFQLDESVLRYLTLKLSKDALEQIEQSKIQAAALQEEEKAATEPVVNEINISEDKNEELNSEPEKTQ
jgi:small subunit ribosomal protein S6